MSPSRSTLSVTQTRISTPLDMSRAFASLNRVGEWLRRADGFDAGRASWRTPLTQARS